LTVAQAHAGGMDFTALKVTVASKDGITHLFPIEAQIDGGRFAGDLTIDLHGVIPTVSLDEQLTGVDMAKLLANSAQKGRLSGRANLLLKATGRGASMDAVLRSMNGHVDAGIADGAFEGVDVAFEIGRVQSLLDSHAPAPANTRRTKFDEFKASAQISNGVAVTKDVTIASAAIKVSGEGSANLPTKMLDFRLLASILTAPATKLVDIPLRITGPYSDPTVKADINEVAKDQLKQKLQDVLKKNGLQGLFGK
jgi:AsmA protein